MPAKNVSKLVTLNTSKNASDIKLGELNGNEYTLEELAALPTDEIKTLKDWALEKVDRGNDTEGSRIQKGDIRRSVLTMLAGGVPQIRGYFNSNLNVISEKLDILEIVRHCAKVKGIEEEKLEETLNSTGGNSISKTAGVQNIMNALGVDEETAKSIMSGKQVNIG